jgi:hypothetical protein
LTLKRDKLLPSFAFNDKLRPCIKVKDLRNNPDPSTTFVGDMMDTEGNALAARGVLLAAGPPKLEGLEGVGPASPCSRHII